MTSILLRSVAVRSGIAGRVWFVLLNQIDLLLTVYATSLGLVEQNPFMQSLLIAAPIQLLIFKTVIPCLIAWFIPGRFLIPSIILLLFIVAWNVKELFFFMT